ncbi:MAG: Hsp20/alpha crystallin family protein [Oscillospiraceae bacterium]|nr:Hsp20/alpha crystallin family protein [Oscillospiraceae bacterium]
MLRIMPYERRNFDVFNFFNDIEKDFWGMPQSNICKTDIRDAGDRFVLEAEMPGFDKEDIKIDIEGNSLTLTAEHKNEKEEKDEAGRYIRRERSYGAYQRCFNIANITADKIEAEYKNGLLTVELPKKTAQVPQVKSIDIR